MGGPDDDEQRRAKGQTTMSDVKTKRPIRVHAGLDVYDLPPETRTRRRDSREYAGPLEQHTGEDAVEVEAMPGRFRVVTVESDALAADRLWSALTTAEATIAELRDAMQRRAPETRRTTLAARMYAAFCEHCTLADPGEYPEWGELDEGAHQRWEKAVTMATGIERPAPVQTPREREPAVWAAAYGAAFVAAYLDAASAADGQGDERTERAIADVHVARCRRLADAAVLSRETSR